MDTAAEIHLQDDTDINMDSDMIEDDRSSSLSEIEDDAESPGEETPTQIDPPTEADSEAETERLDNTPNKMGGSKKMMLNTKSFEPSPSKLAQASGAESADEEDSDSAISSPLASTRDSVERDLLDGDEDNIDEPEHTKTQERILNGKKRKRSLLDGDELADAAHGRSRRQRTGSIQSEASIVNDAASENRSISSREGTLEPAENKEADGDGSGANDDDVETEREPTSTMKDNKGKSTPGRRRALRGKATDGEETVQNDVEEAEIPEVDPAESEAEEAADPDDVDDTEVAAKSEEELTKRMAAMDALTNLEKHFAVLRDRLYDERIASINQELAQLTSKRPEYPEFQRQLKIIEKYRDDKFEIEQKLLVHRTGALKRKSLAERAQIHSAYFQTVRDLREKHLEKISEQFYRIQRERFKTENPIPNYAIPFAKDRSQQVSQQIAYNKEVSILSGVAKYVGFPAAPELSNIRASELDQDLSKMGISTNNLKAARRGQVQSIPTTFSGTLSRPQAEEQFLEQTPWANPQHPLSQQVQRISRQASEQARAQETPAVQRIGDSGAPHGSASTIPEPNNSAAASSAFNTPFGDQVTHAPLENGDNRQPYRVQSASPSENRKANPQAAQQSSNQTLMPEQKKIDAIADTSPLLNRAAPASPRSGATTLDRLPRHDNQSPLDIHRNTNAGILASGVNGLGRFGIR